MNVRALVAEAVGTFILVFFGSLGVATWLIASQGSGDPLTALLILPFAFGLALLAGIAITSHVSGAHFNPAVTLAVALDGRLDWLSAFGYLVAQIIGAFAASIAILLTTTMSIVKTSVNQPGPVAEATFDRELHAFAIEVLLTAVFIAVILTVTKKTPNLAIVVIPLTLVAIHFVGIFTSGASVNPVRSLAPAVVSGTYDSLWVYLTGPFVGAILGWALYRFLTPPDDDMELEPGDDEFDDLDED